MIRLGRGFGVAEEETNIKCQCYKCYKCYKCYGAEAVEGRDILLRFGDGLRAEDGIGPGDEAELRWLALNE